MRIGIAVMALALVIEPAAAAPSQPPAIYTQPVALPTEDGPLRGEEGFVAVPENRAKAGSRTILISFYRVKALKPSGRQPIFILPGGPGDLYDRRNFESPRWPWPVMRRNVRRLAADRDVVFVNQRGNSFLPVVFSQFRAPAPKFAADADPIEEQQIEAWRVSLERTYAELTAAGVDLAGYDIRNCVEDLEDVRAALGYDRIVIQAISFGSQWALSYLRVHPENVARAVLSGVEPIDYGYDSPDGLWNVLKRIAAAAEASPIRADLPPGGLARAVSTILAGLEAKPAQVSVPDPKSGKPVSVTIRREDFQALLLRPWSGAMLRDAAGAWPKFVTEVYNGDYRYVALRKLAGLSAFNGNLNLPLIDHSLGISATRDARLKSEGATAILGDPNLAYRRWAAGTPTREVDDDFRRLRRIDTPILLIQGDADWSTPFENATDQYRQLTNGALITVRGGTHLVQYELTERAAAVDEQVSRFLTLDANPDADPRAILAAIPKTVDIPLAFLPVTGPSLYDQALAARGAR